MPSSPEASQLRPEGQQWQSCLRRLIGRVQARQAHTPNSALLDAAHSRVRVWGVVGGGGGGLSAHAIMLPRGGASTPIRRVAQTTSLDTLATNQQHLLQPMGRCARSRGHSARAALRRRSDCLLVGLLARFSALLLT